MTGRQTTHDPNEDDRVKAEIGECLYAGDHEDVGGVCIHCGAEFDDVRAVLGIPSPAQDAT